MSITTYSIAAATEQIGGLIERCRIEHLRAGRSTGREVERGGGGQTP